MVKKVKEAQRTGPDRIKILKGIIGVLAILIILLLVILVRTAPRPSGFFEPFTLAIAGYERVSISISPPNTIILADASSCRQIEATTTLEQTDSIFNALSNRTSPRPNAHDLAKIIFSEYGIELISVKIDDFKDGNYHSTLVLQQGNKVLFLDARPSDGIALALRMGRPVYIKSEFFEILGKRVC